MGTERRTSGDSLIFIGRQTKRGAHITGDTVFQGIAPDWKDLTNITAALINQRFPFVRNTLDPTSESTESESITGNNAALPDIITKRSAAGEWEFEVLPEDAIHLLLGWFNPSALPTNTAIVSLGTDGEIPTGKITVNSAIPSGTPTQQTITIDNGDETAIAKKWPGTLKIKADAASALAGTGKIQIFGEQRRSRSNNFNSSVIETLSNVDADDLKGTTGVDTKKFYRKINKIVLSGFTTFEDTTKKPTLTFQADTKSADLTLNALNALFAGWTTQMLKASTPYIGFDIVPNSFRLTVSGTNMRLVLTVIASYVQEGRVLLKPLDIAYKLPQWDRPHGGTELSDYEGETAQSGQKAVLENYPVKNLNFYPANGTAVALGEPGQTLAQLQTAVDAGTATIVPITSIEINGTHNYDEPDGFTGDPVGGEPITAEGESRTVTVNATIVHETDQHYSLDNKTAFWQDRYFEGQEIPIIVRNYNWEPDGRQNLIETRFKKCRLTEVPNLPIEGQGQANRTLAFGAYPTDTGAPDDIEMTFYSKSGFAEG